MCIDIRCNGVAAQTGQDAVKAALIEFFAIYDGIEHVKLSAAVFLIEPQAAVACIAEFFEGLLADGMVLLHVHVVGNDLSVEEFAKLFTECFMLLGEGQKRFFR